MVSVVQEKLQEQVKIPVDRIIEQIAKQSGQILEADQLRIEIGRRIQYGELASGEQRDRLDEATTNAVLAAIEEPATQGVDAEDYEGGIARQWLNENRSDGLVTIIGFQNMTQLEKAYSREVSRSILGGCATKAIFNPQDLDSARWFSDYLGEEEVSIKQKSKSTGKGGGSTSTSDHLQKRHIVEAAQFVKLPTCSERT